MAGQDEQPKRPNEPQKSEGLATYFYLFIASALVTTVAYFSPLMDKEEGDLTPKNQDVPKARIVAIAPSDAPLDAKPEVSVSESFDVTSRGSQVQTRTPEITVLYKEGTQLLLQLDMQVYRKARFEITMGDKVDGWCVNVGDSPTNNGWRGDSSSFSHDAELQIAGATGGLAIYGNDYTRNTAVDNENAQFLAERGFAQPGETVTLEVADGYAAWDNHRGSKGELKSEFLFALNGQYDAEHEGANDKMLYAAFNRLILEGNMRKAEGCVSAVTVTLVK